MSRNWDDICCKRRTRSVGILLTASGSAGHAAQRQIEEPRPIIFYLHSRCHPAGALASIGTCCPLLVARPSDGGVTHAPDSCTNETDRSGHRDSADDPKAFSLWNCLGTPLGARKPVPSHPRCYPSDAYALRRSGQPFRLNGWPRERKSRSRQGFACGMTQRGATLACAVSRRPAPRPAPSPSTAASLAPASP